MTSIISYSKNYGSLTHETRIKDAVNMEDLICLLATVRTLKSLVGYFFLIMGPNFDKELICRFFSCKYKQIINK